MKSIRPEGRAQSLGRSVRTGALALLQSLADQTGPAAGEDLARRMGALYREALVVAYRLLYLRELAALEGERLPAGAAQPLLELGRALREAGGCGALEVLFRALLRGEGDRGALFAPGATSALAALPFEAEAAAALVRRLLAPRGKADLDESARAEALGRSYEALAALDCSLALEPMVRLRRGDFEAVVPAAAAERFRRAPSGAIRWVEAVPEGSVSLSAGLARKASGAYFTPLSLRRLLVRKTLEPLVGRATTEGALLELRLLDPAMGGGHMLLEACRFLGAQVGSGQTLENELDSRAEVAARCLHGIDLDPVAAEVARLALSLETGGRVAPGGLAGHLVAGDALVGPWAAELGEGPVSGRPLAALPRARLDACLARGAAHRLAAAWVDAVAAGDPAAEEGYLARLDDEAAAAGPEGPRSPAEREARAAAPQGGPRSEQTATPDALCLDFAFPEVFGAPRPGPGRGFDAVLGNPPWDKLIPLDRELHARFDPEVLEARTARERRPLYDRLDEDPEVRRARDAARCALDRTLAFVARTYRHQSAPASAEGGRRGAAGHQDSYRLFVERAWTCLREGGRLGLVLPAAVYANQGSTGVRRLLLEDSRVELCLGFTNRRRLFDIAAGQRFALVVAVRGGQTDAVEAAFGLEDPDELQATPGRGLPLRLSMELVRRVSPEHLCLPECGSKATVAAAEAAFRGGHTWGAVAAALGVDLGQEMNMTTDSPRFVPSEEVLSRMGLLGEGDPRREPLRTRLREAGWLVVHEKGTFRAYDDLLKDRPRYLCSARALLGAEGPEGLRPKAQALEASRSYRLALRATIHASEARKVVACLLPPGAVVGNSALVELRPAGRPAAAALSLLAMANSRPTGFVARLRVQTNLNKFLLKSLPLPALDERELAFLADAALRLTCCHEAYAPLWQELRGEPRPAPAETPKARAALLAAIDAVVARGLGLSRECYEEVLGSSGRPLAPEERAAFLAAFELAAEKELQLS